MREGGGGDILVAAIGRATAQVLQRRGFAVDLMPNEANAAALVDAFAAVGYYWHFVDVVWILVFSIIYLRVLA